MSVYVWSGSQSVCWCLHARRLPPLMYGPWRECRNWSDTQGGPQIRQNASQVLPPQGEYWCQKQRHRHLLAGWLPGTLPAYINMYLNQIYDFMFPWEFEKGQKWKPPFSAALKNPFFLSFLPSICSDLSHFMPPPQKCFLKQLTFAQQLLLFLIPQEKM